MKSTSRGFIPVLIAILVGLVVLGGSAYFAMRQQPTPEPTPQNEITVNTDSNAQVKQNTAPAATQTQTNNSVKTTVQTPPKTTLPAPAPVSNTVAPSTTCTYTSNTGVAKTATAAQASTPESCQTVCVNIRNEVFGPSDSGVCEFKRSTGGDYIYNIQPSSGAASTNLTLASSVFATPKGTLTLKFPQNWTPTVVVDGSLGTTIVTSTNPNDHSDTLSLAINTRPSDYTTDSDINSSTASITSKGGQILSTAKTSNGYVMEARFQSTGRHTKLVRIETASNIYLVSESAAEGDWNTYSSFFTQAVATLQIY